MQKHFHLPIILFFLALQFVNASAQDSLIIQRDTFDVKDRIEFYPKVAATLSVPTLSCSCGNSDFMYRVYRLENGKWKLFLNHSEQEDEPKCNCKYFATQLKDGVMYSIDAINASGTFYLELIGGKPHAVSKKFILLEK
ncbi:MAG: hypothetical protein IPP27_14065 [Bacteroidetes bacterium]|jgi:hypothetical protein|nr:hypothetical protein [Bacteroidota bacterium]MBK9415367.1 hypothetical protein [Bacteroidota bacterium]MBL0033232.1 hypothetical protein [Bacteroidota bacterium]